MDKQEIKIYDNPLIKNLERGIIAINQSNWKVDVVKVDKLAVNLEIKKYKNENGSINFLAIRDIPVDRRITALAKKDLGGTVKIITVALTLALETINVTRPMNASQIVDLAEIIVETAESDKLSVEDVLLFLQKLTRGEYPGLYEGIDQAKILERFNQYRDERWNEFVRLRNEKDGYFMVNGEWEKIDTSGDNNHYERNNRMSPLGEEMAAHRKKIEQKKDEIALLKRENEILRQQRDF